MKIIYNFTIFESIILYRNLWKKLVINLSIIQGFLKNNEKIRDEISDGNKYICFNFFSFSEQD